MSDTPNGSTPGAGRRRLPSFARRLLEALARIGLDLRPALLRTRDVILRPVRDELAQASDEGREGLRVAAGALRLEVQDRISSSHEALLAETREIRARIQEDLDALRAQQSDLPAGVARRLADAEAAQGRAAARFDERLAELASRLETERHERRSRMEAVEGLLTEAGTACQPALDRLLGSLDSPIVSVILPTRNRAHVVADAIASVEAQRFSAWELIVVDDGSTDETATAVAPYLADPRIRFVSLPPGGVGRSRNQGLALARGALIAYLDSDNVWYPDFLAGAVNAFAIDPALGLVYGVLVTDSHGLDGTRLLWKPFDREQLLQWNFIDGNVVVHRKSLADRYGGTDESLERLADWDLVLRYTEHAPARPLPVLAARYRVCDGHRITDTRPVGPSYVAVRRKWYPGSGPGHRPRVLYALRRHPALADVSVRTEIDCMVRWGVGVEVWRQDSSGPRRAASVPVHDGSLAEAVGRFKPDLIHVHGFRLAELLEAQFDELRLPVTIRADGLEGLLDGVVPLPRSSWAYRIYPFPHQPTSVGPGDPRLRAVPAAFDAAFLRPAAKKDRRLVLAAAGPSPRRDVRLFLELAKRLPDHRCVLAAERCGVGRGYGEGLRLVSRTMDSPAEVLADLEREEFLALVAEAGLFLDTARPPRAGVGAPLGTLSGLAEAMATGCHLLVPDVSDLREFPGKAGTLFRDVTHAAEIVAATATWTDAAWMQAEIASLDRAFMTHADELALRPVFEDWCAVAAAGPLPGKPLPVERPRSEARTWKGSVIPPADLTPCGHLTDTPEKLYVSACEEVDRIARNIGLHRSTTILDIGCGAGRLPIGLLARRAEFSFYLGIDVSRDRVEWCTRNLSTQDARLHFQFVDMPNARYNPSGQAPLRLAAPPASFDVVYLYSVFSHLLEPDVRSYLDLIATAMRPGGICFTTMFVADGVPPVTENPADFGPFEWSGPLHCVLYERHHWQEMLATAGLAVLREVPRVNVDQQTGYFLVHEARRRVAGASGGKRTRRCFVGFFGLNRSLRWTHDSIERNILDPLAAAGFEPAIAAHFNCPPTIHSPRSGEFHVPFHMMGLEELGPELLWLEPQSDRNVADDLPLVLRTPFKNEEDPDGLTRRNALHQLHSLSRLSLLLDTMRPDSFDLFVLARADLMYLDPVPMPEIVEMIGQGVDLVTPGWHRWTGLNDRFAFCSRRGAYAYMNRRRWIRSLCEESGTFHSESLLLHAAERTGLKRSETGVRARRVRASGEVREEDFTL